MVKRKRSSYYCEECRGWFGHGENCDCKETLSSDPPEASNIFISILQESKSAKNLSQEKHTF